MITGNYEHWKETDSTRRQTQTEWDKDGNAKSVWRTSAMFGDTFNSQTVNQWEKVIWKTEYSRIVEKLIFFMIQQLIVKEHSPNWFSLIDHLTTDRR